MNFSIFNRFIIFTVVLATAFTAWAQNTPDIVSDINKGGKVTVTLPDGLTSRDNDDIGKNQQATRPEEPQDAKKETKTTVDDTPKRMHTTAQTVQGRKVGFRIQCYTDNSANGKANVQARARMIAMKFPHYRTYISYNAPQWRLRIGDFKDQGEANAAIARVRAAFPQMAGSMMLVKDNVNVWSK